MDAQWLWSSLHGEGWKHAGGLSSGERLQSWYAGACPLHLCCPSLLSHVLYTSHITTFQVHKRLHLSSWGILPGEWVLPRSCALLFPQKSEEKPASERFRQKLAKTSSISRWGKRNCKTWNHLQIKEISWTWKMQVSPSRPQSTCRGCTCATWLQSIVGESSLSGRSRWLERTRLIYKM